MKTRLLAAAVLIPFMLLMVLVAPTWMAAVVFALMMAVATYELLYRTRLVRHLRLVLYSSVAACGVVIWSYFGAMQAYLLLGMLLFSVLLFMEMMLDHVKVRVEMLGLCFFGGFVVPFLLSALIRILTMKIGRYVILIPFIVAFTNDAGAYFAGRFFGKHKMAPVLSQHKTVEGAVGGVLAAVVSMVLYAVIMSLPVKGLAFRVNYLYAIIYGFVGALIGIFGDLCFSVIKRQTGIKDYGKLLPGHGGMMDRFDSTVFAAPAILVLVWLMPAF